MEATLRQYIEQRAENYGSIAPWAAFPHSWPENHVDMIDSAIGRACRTSEARYRRDEALALFHKEAQRKARTIARVSGLPVSIDDVFAVAYRTHYSQHSVSCRPN